MTDQPYSTGIFETIVNVHFGGIIEDAVLGLFTGTNSGTSESNSFTQISQDGVAWGDGFGNPSSNAASGSNNTVVCAGDKFVAYGKPRDGEACFVTVTRDGTVEQGLPDPHGGINWSGTLAASLPAGSGATSCSFAGGMFFISYTNPDIDGDAAYLAVSTDGSNFTHGVEPFLGVLNVAIGTGGTYYNGDPDGVPTPLGGNVAFNKATGTYVTTGTYNRRYIGEFLEAPGENFTPDNELISLITSNFMSSVSTDGINWRPKFDTSEGGGQHPEIDGTTSIFGCNNGSTNVTFGNGIFVASTGFKINYPFNTNGLFPAGYLTRSACSVAISRDGVSWTNLRLPNTVSSGPIGFDAGGEGTVVRFFKTKKATKNAPNAPTGFFVATGLEYDKAVEFNTTFASKAWVSLDGSSWLLTKNFPNESYWILTAVNRSRGTVSFR